MTTLNQLPTARISKDQLLTIGDLIEFKQDLLAEIRKMFSQPATGIPQPKQWLKSKEVRGLLQISGGKLMTMRVNGTLPYTRIGGVIYYEFKDIEQMLENLKFKKDQHLPQLRADVSR
jgi:hypothetical protein